MLMVDFLIQAGAEVRRGVPGFTDAVTGQESYTPNNPSLEFSSLGAGATALSSDNFNQSLASSEITHNQRWPPH